jgi:hypothetical protein
MKTFIFILTLLLSVSVLGEPKVLWPDLTNIKYVSKRHAVESDISNDAAVFLLKSNGIYIGKPMSIDIPQYAIHTDGESGVKTNVIIIQAEEANGQQVLGALNIETNGFLAGLYGEFKLLGKQKPN